MWQPTGSPNMLRACRKPDVPSNQLQRPNSSEHFWKATFMRLLKAALPAPETSNKLRVFSCDKAMAIQKPFGLQIFIPSTSKENLAQPNSTRCPRLLCGRVWDEAAPLVYLDTKEAMPTEPARPSGGLAVSVFLAVTPSATPPPETPYLSRAQLRLLPQFFETNFDGAR